MTERRVGLEEFQGVVLTKLDSLKEGQQEIKDGLWGKDGVKDRVGVLEGDVKVHGTEISDLKKDRPRVFWLVGIASLIGGFLGRLIPWRG